MIVVDDNSKKQQINQLNKGENGRFGTSEISEILFRFQILFFKKGKKGFLGLSILRNYKEPLKSFCIPKTRRNPLRLFEIPKSHGKRTDRSR